MASDASDIFWHPSIQTERLFLRPASLHDLPGIHVYRSLPEVQKWVSPWPTANKIPTLEETREWLKPRIWPLRFNFSIFLASSSTPRDTWRLIGMIGCPRGAPEFGYATHSEMWGKGYGTEAIKGFLELYWQCVPSPSAGGLRGNGGGWEAVEGLQPEVRAFDHIEARVRVDNKASARALVKCGFRAVPSEVRDDEDGATEVKYRLDRDSRQWARDLG
ncbi:MAG: hypothetical protein Q9159_004424 [Coniocarpon cinnabarinum]